MEERAQERQTAKQHQIYYFPSWAARWGKKKHKDKQRGPTFSLHTNRKGLWERKSHRRENSPLVVPINFPGNQLGDLLL